MAANKLNVDLHVGESYGKWTVLDYSHTDTKRQQYWRCRCSCGTSTSIRASHIVRGLSKGCSTCRNQSLKGNKSPNWKGGDFLSHTRVLLIQASALYRDIEYDVSIEYLERLFKEQDGKCAYSGVSLSFEDSLRERPDATASLDRTDPSRGYVVGNVKWVHKDINRMKMSLSEDRFLELCCLVADERSACSGV